MFFLFFTELRAAKIAVSLREYLSLMEAMHERVAAFAIEDFYVVARTALVKDERHLDRFDRANQALADLRSGALQGAAVLVP